MPVKPCILIIFFHSQHLYALSINYEILIQCGLQLDNHFPHKIRVYLLEINTNVKISALDGS